MVEFNLTLNVLILAPSLSECYSLKYLSGDFPHLPVIKPLFYIAGLLFQPTTNMTSIPTTIGFYYEPTTGPTMQCLINASPQISGHAMFNKFHNLSPKLVNSNLQKLDTFRHGKTVVLYN